MPLGSEKPARIRLEAPSGKLGNDLRVAEDKLRKFSQRSRRMLSDSPRRGREKSGGAKLISAARVGVGALEKVGSTLFETFSSGVGDALDFERGLTRFKIAGNLSGVAMYELRNQILNVARATGVSRNEILAGSAAYLALTGDVDGASQSSALFAKVSNATGASMTDIATTAASMRDNLKIDRKDFESGFSALIVQGKAGAIELKDLSQELAGIAPQFSAFNKGAGLSGLATMGAALQAGRKGFSSASEAATGFRSMMSAVQRNAEKFKGVKIFNKDPRSGVKTLRSFHEIVDGISKSKLAKDPTLLTAAFGSSEAKRFYDQLVLNKGMIADLEKQSSDGGAVSVDALTYQQSAAGKLEQAMETLKISIASAFTPERIQQFAGALERIAKAAGNFADAFNAVFEFGAVRDMKNRNEAELVKMGEYTGSDAGMQRESWINAKRIAIEDEKRRHALREARINRVLSAAGPGALQLQTGPFPQSVVAPKAETQSRLPPTSPTPSPTVVLSLDGDVLATSTANARQSRRNLGGR